MSTWINENTRNTSNSKLYEAIIRTVFDDVEQVGCGHHLMFSRSNGVLDEFPSADYLIFNHDVAKRLWGDHYKHALTRLALAPVETRDQLLHKLFYEGLVD